MASGRRNVRCTIRGFEKSDDSRVVGDEPYVSLHLMGAAQYGKKGR
jgi:hypothetical protein